MRQEDLPQRQGENLIEYRNGAARFEKEIERIWIFIHSSACKRALMNTDLNVVEEDPGF